MCIRMLQVLNTGRIFKISELAEILETNPRNVIEYKKELDEISFECGFIIETVPGRYGGYRLNGNAALPTTKLTNTEKKTLVDSYNYLLSDKGVLNKQNIVDVYSKIMSNMLIEDKNHEVVSESKFDVTKDVQKIKSLYETMERSIKNKKALVITYDFLKEKTHQVKVHPYQLFIYENEWRFFGWNCEIGDIFYFKLSRILDIQETDEKFVVWKYFKIEKYLKDGVFVQSGETFKAVLIATGVRAKIFKEKNYGKNQVCEDLPDGRTKVTLEMQKNPSTYNFILGCGDLVEVVEPLWLKEKIIELAQNILNSYIK